MVDELKEIRKTPNKALIEILESMLEKAEAGEIQGSLFVHVWDDESTSHGWSVPNKKMAPRMVGAMHMLLADVANYTNGIDSRVIVDAQD